MAFRKNSGAGKRAANLFTAAEALQNRKMDHIFARLFRGEVSLTLTFWTFFISIPLLAEMLFSHFLFPLVGATTTLGTLVLSLWGVVALGYMVVACVGLWRAAAHASTPAKTQVCRAFSVLGFIASLCYSLYLYGCWLMLNS